MRCTGHGRMYTRVMKVEDEDNVDAGFVKRGREEEEEVDKYVRVMRKAEDTNTYSRPALEDLIQEILKRRVDGKMDGNVFEIMLMKKEATKKRRALRRHRVPQTNVASPQIHQNIPSTRASKDKES